MGCGGCREAPEPPRPEPEWEAVCALPALPDAPGWGDANQDGQVDLSDAVRTLRALQSGGAAPACLEAMDVGFRDDLVDVGDALGLLYPLFVGNASLPAGSPDCEALEPLEEAPCGRLRLSLDAPETVSGVAGETVTFTAVVQLESPELEVEGWSFGVRAEGCALASATEDGTTAADTRLDPAGRRDQGWLRTDVTQAEEGGSELVSSVVLSWLDPVALPAQEAPSALLSLTLTATAPTSGCAPCTLTLEDGLVGPGLPVAALVSSGGRRLEPVLQAGVVEVCAP